MSSPLFTAGVVLVEKDKKKLHTFFRTMVLERILGGDTMQGLLNCQQLINFLITNYLQNFKFLATILFYGSE